MMLALAFDKSVAFEVGACLPRWPPAVFFLQETSVGQENKINTIIKPALESLKDLKDSKQKFDFVFIDADKENNKNYYNKSLDLIDKNGLIIIDNVLWHGEVIDITKNDKLTVGIREFNSYVHNDRRVENLIIPVGDGLTVCRKL